MQNVTGGKPSRHLRCNPTQKLFEEGGIGQRSEVGVLPGRLPALPRGHTGSQTDDAERILPEHGLPPKIRDSPAERAAAWETTGAASAGTAAALRAAGGERVGGGLGGGRLSLVGTAESLAAELDAVDWQALLPESAPGAAVAGDQCAANRPTAEEQEARTETTDLRAHQTRRLAEAPHPGEDRPLGCADGGVQRD